MKVLLFAGIAEAIGQHSLTIPLKKASVKELKNYLIEKYPQVESSVERAMVAVNQEFAEEETIVTETDEVALIPPVSGG